MAKTLGRVIRLAREKAGLSQAAVAKRVGLAPSHLARIESGARLEPRFETIARLASALGLSLDEIAADCGIVPERKLDTGSAATALRIAERLDRLAGDLAIVASEAADAAKNLRLAGGSKGARAASRPKGLH